MRITFLHVVAACALSALLLIFAITGCTASPYDVEDVGSIPDDKAVVSGEILFPPRQLYAHVDVIDADNGHRVVSSAFPPNVGYFAMLLPVGKYMLLDAYYRGGDGIGPIRARFDVTKPRTVIFIGTIDIRRGRPIVSLDEGKAHAAFATRYKSLNALPIIDAAATIGEEKLEPFMDRSSFIEPVEKPFFVAISPRALAGFFNDVPEGYGVHHGVHPCTVESLHPVLKWHSANPSDKVFDLIIYSAVPRYVGETVVVSYVPGIEVYYKQGLTSTEHLVEKQWGCPRSSGA